MATNLDVDVAAIEELMAEGGFKSKREAVDAAIREALAYRRQLKSIGFLGTIDFKPVVVEQQATQQTVSGVSGITGKSGIGGMAGGNHLGRGR